MDDALLETAFKLTADILSDAYDVDAAWAADILKATYAPPQTGDFPTVPILADEPVHPSTLATRFRPNLYSALRSLDAPDAVDLFSEPNNFERLARIEATFAELQRSVPLTNFREVREMIKPFLYHQHLARAGLRYTGVPTSRFKDCPLLDRYFTNHFDLVANTGFSDFELPGQQSQYAKMYYEFFEERNRAVHHIRDRDSNITYSHFSRDMIPANPDAPKIPIPDFAVLEKKRRGTILSIFGLKVLRDIEKIKFDEKTKVSFIEKFVLFREFNRRPENIEKQIEIRSSINEFVRDCLSDFGPALGSTNSPHLQVKLANRLLKSNLATNLSLVDGSNTSAWNFPFGLSANDLYFKDRRLDKIFEFARIIDFNGDSKFDDRDGVVRAIQRQLFAVIESDRFDRDGGQGFIPLSLYEAVREADSLIPIANACNIFDENKILFRAEPLPISLKTIRVVQTKKPTTSFSFEDNFRLYHNYEKQIEIEFGPRTRRAIEVLMIGKHFDYSTAKRASEIKRQLFEIAEQDEERRKKVFRSGGLGRKMPAGESKNKKYAWRLDSDIFGSKHPAIKHGLIKIGRRFVDAETGISEHTFFINPELRDLEP